MKILVAIALWILGQTLTAYAQMHSGGQMQDFNKVFGLKDDDTSAYTVTLLSSSCPGNVLYPGEQPTFTFVVKNNEKTALQCSGKIDVLLYGTRGIPGDVWIPQVIKFDDLPSLPINVSIPAEGSQVIEVKPVLPEKFGGYAFIMDLGIFGRHFAATCARTFAQTGQTKIQFPRMSLDATPGLKLLSRLGIRAVRFGVDYIPTDAPRYPQRMADLGAQLRAFSDNNITVLLTLDGVGGPQPLGRGRPYLNADNVMMTGSSDMAYLPKNDPDFRKFVGSICSQYGWPKGPVTAVQLWNEPWEGFSIAAWGGDNLRYREIYTAMAQGVEDARAKGADILLTGCDSSSNTLDKLFPDGKDTFTKLFDACTIHYQGLASPAIYKPWLERKGPHGRVQIWDTESWVGNSDDRVACVVAADRAAGYDRAMGVFWANVSSPNTQLVTLPDGTTQHADSSNTWAAAAAVGAATHFIGQRDFRELLFKNGLPWVMIFDGLENNPDDGTVVITGDLSDTFAKNGLLFRNVDGIADVQKREELQKQLKALALGSPDRAVLEKQLATPTRLSGGSLKFQNPGKEFVLYDFYGNEVPATDDAITVPLDTRGFFLRTTGASGSFSRLTKALATAQIEGYQPVQMVAHDLIAPIENKPSLRMTLTNILNRPISGTLQATLGDLTLELPPTIALQPNETKEVLIPVTGGQARSDNTYSLKARFDAQADGYAIHQENLHVNVIAKRTIHVDGSLDDWKGVLPQSVQAITANQGPSLMESAWLPFKKFDASQKSGFATAYLAYDKNYFYFAAKVADTEPSPGTIRFAKRNDDDYFYPDKSFEYEAGKTLLKKDEVWDQPQRTEAALLLPASASERSFTAWSSVSTAFAVDLKMPQNSYRQVSFYFVDWDEEPKGRRSTTIEVHDAVSNKVLATAVATGYGRGKYARFLISGNVRVTFRSNVGWLSASLSGLFFDPATAADQPSGETSAKFLDFDTTTAGDWSKAYGHDGHLVIGAPPHYPAYASVNAPDVISKKDHIWPEGVRHYSYRKDPILPFGSSPRFDNIQIAFNVIPEDQKTNMVASAPGTMHGFVNYEDTDYEYALNPVAKAYGGGTEIWRCIVPGMVRKHFYPRQPASPLDGPVRNGQLTVKQDGNTRIEEAAIPWSEIPLVKKALNAGETIKFSFRINAAHGPSMELAEGRSVSKTNCYTFHPDWIQHWSNEVEFGFEK